MVGRRKLEEGRRETTQRINLVPMAPQEKLVAVVCLLVAVYYFVKVGYMIPDLQVRGVTIQTVVHRVSCSQDTNVQKTKTNQERIKKETTLTRRGKILDEGGTIR